MRNSTSGDGSGDYESIVAMIFHAALQGLDLSTATRTIVFPQIPKMAGMFTNVLVSETFAEILASHFISIVMAVVMIGMVYFKKVVSNFIGDTFSSIAAMYRYLFTSDNVTIDGVVYKKTTIEITDPANVIAMMKFINSNSSNSDIFSEVSMTEIDHKYFMTFKQKVKKYEDYNYGFNCMFTYKDLKSEFDRFTIKFPKKMTLKMKVPKNEFGQKFVTIDLTTDCTKEPVVKDDAEKPTKRTKDTETAFDDMKIKLELSYQQNGFNPIEFMNFFNEKIKEFIEVEYQKILNAKKDESITKHFYGRELSLTIYNGPIISSSDRINIYLGKFIHQKAEELRMRVNVFMKDCVGDSFNELSAVVPYMSLMIHGKPGSGKSTIADRLALALKRDIQVLDLAEFTNYDKLIKALTEVRSNKTIVVIDEVDKAIVKIMEDEEKAKNNNQASITCTTIYNDVLDGFPVVDASDDSIDAKKKEKPESKKKETPSDSTEDSDETSDKKKETTEEIKISMPTRPGYHCRKYNYDVEKLLPVFDGTIQPAGSITIATTNNPDILAEIGSGKTKGAMVRAGRLEPFYVGYFDRDTVDKFMVVKYGENHGIVVPDRWFDKNNELIIQNSNFVSILKFSEPHEFIRNIDGNIKAFDEMQKA